MRLRLISLLALALLALQPLSARAEQVIQGSFRPTTTICVNPSTNLLESCGGGGGGSAAPFALTGHTLLAVTTSTGRVALPSADTTVVLGNIGSNTVYFKLGSGSVTAATTDVALLPGAYMQVAAGTSVDVAGITAASTSTLDVMTGTGSGFVTSGTGSSTTDQPVVCNTPCAISGTTTSNQGAAGIAPWPVAFGTDATFSYAVVGLVPVASATDIAVVQASGSKITRIVSIEVSCVAGTLGIFDVSLVKRSTANTGTANTITGVPNLSTSLAATATVKTWTAGNPTLGTAVGTVAAKKLTCTTAATPPLPADSVRFDSGMMDGGLPLTLIAGGVEGVGVNLNGGTVSSGLIDLTIRTAER